MDYLDYVDVSENESSDGDDEFLHAVFDIVFLHRLMIFHHRPNPLIKYRDPKFFQRFRFSKSTVKFIISLIKDEIKSPTERYSTFFVPRSTSSVGLKIIIWIFKGFTTFNFLRKFI